MAAPAGKKKTLLVAGGAQVAAADAFMAEQGIRDPSRFAAAFLPGPW